MPDELFFFYFFFFVLEFRVLYSCLFFTHVTHIIIDIINFQIVTVSDRDIELITHNVR